MKMMYSFCILKHIRKSAIGTNCHNRLRWFSSRAPPVTLQTIFGEENKERVKDSLLSVKPVRTLDQIKRQSEKDKSAEQTEHRHDSAVLIPLCFIDNQPSIIYTLRSMNLNKHRGQVSFPGGRKDDSDPDLTFTAVRETSEELGIPHDQVDVWGCMTPIPNRQPLSSFTTPVLGYCGHVDLVSLKPNHDEVESVFSSTIESLVNPTNIRTTKWRTGRGYTMPVYIGGEHRIWGLTAIATHQALTLIAPGLYNFKIKYFS